MTDITETVKTALETMLTKNTWMDQSTKDFAISKVGPSLWLFCCCFVVVVVVILILMYAFIVLVHF